MNKKDLNHFKEKLIKEKTQLEEQLNTISRLNPDVAGDWEATTTDIEVDPADENEVADKMEELEENNAILSQLEPQLNEVKAALDRIEKGTYGICEKTGQPIEKERLEANPSARTALGSMKE